MHRRTHFITAAALAGILAFAAPASADARDDVHLSATWGQTISSQLLDESPISIWNVAMEAPLIRRIGLSTQMRFDSIVFGEPGNLLSLMVHPGRTDYNLGLRWLPAGSSLGVELHHVSSHEVRALHDGSRAKFESTVDVGGASNFLSLLFRGRGIEARIGAGSSWTDTNTAPMLLGLEGVLLNTRIAHGPFATLNLPYRWSGISGRAGGVYIHDREAVRSNEGDVLAWGTSMRLHLFDELSVGASYLGNNGIEGVKRSDSIVALFLQLRWLEARL